MHLRGGYDTDIPSREQCHLCRKLECQCICGLHIDDNPSWSTSRKEFPDPVKTSRLRDHIRNWVTIFENQMEIECPECDPEDNALPTHFRNRVKDRQKDTVRGSGRRTYGQKDSSGKTILDLLWPSYLREITHWIRTGSTYPSQTGEYADIRSQLSSYKGQSPSRNTLTSLLSQSSHDGFANDTQATLLIPSKGNQEVEIMDCTIEF